MNLSDLPEEILEEICSYLSGKDRLKLFEQNHKFYNLISQRTNLMKEITVQFTYDNFYNDYKGPLQSLGFLNKDWEDLYKSTRKFQNLRIVGKKECLLPFVKIPLVVRFLDNFGGKLKTLSIYDISIDCKDLEKILIMLPNLETLKLADIWLQDYYNMNPKFPKLKSLEIVSFYTNIFTYKNILKSTDRLVELSLKCREYIPRRMVKDIVRQKGLKFLDLETHSVPTILTNKKLQKEIKFQLQGFKTTATVDESLKLLPFIESQEKLEILEIQNPNLNEDFLDEEIAEMMEVIFKMKHLHRFKIPSDFTPTMFNKFLLPQYDSIDFQLIGDDVDIYEEFETLNKMMPNLKHLEFRVLFPPPYVNFRCINEFKKLEGLHIHGENTFILSQLELPSLKVLEADFRGCIPDAHLLTFLQKHPHIKSLRFNHGFFSPRVLNYIHWNLMCLQDLCYGYNVYWEKELCEELGQIIEANGGFRKTIKLDERM
jgi:hypothetical protein